MEHQCEKVPDDDGSTTATQKEGTHKDTNTALYVVYLIGFLDLFGVSMIIPLIPSHAKALGASSTVAGLLGSLYGGIQLMSSPIAGRWSDISGHRHVLIMCMLLSASGYFMLSFSSFLVLLFIARIPTGIFKHSLNISRAYIADITPKKEQTAVLGRFGAMGSLGFMIGPTVGGHIAEMQGGFYMVSALGGAMFVLNAGLSWLFLPEVKSKSHPELTRDESGISLKKIASDEINAPSLTSFLQSFHNIDWKNLWDIFLIRFLLGSAMLVYRSNFSLFLQGKFDTSVKTSGYVMSYNAMVSVVAGFVLGKIAKFYDNDERLLHQMSWVMFITMLGTTVLSDIKMFLFLSTFLSLSTSIIRNCMIKLTLKRGLGSHDTGALMGLSQSVISFARITSPTIAGLLAEVTILGQGFLGSALILIALGLMTFSQFNTATVEHKKKDQ